LKKWLHLDLLTQFAFDLLDQLITLLIHFILSVKESATFVVTLSLQNSDLLLSSKLFLQREGGRAGAARLLDLPISVLDFEFQAKF
jgi:hypothetical protein